MFDLSRLRALLLSIEQAIGWNDPDLNHGRVGRSTADEKIGRRKSAGKSGRNRRLDASQPRRPLNISAR